jgi:predicted MFS family arabinose efflux permease
MGASNTAMSVGMIISPLVSGLVMDRFGIASVFYLSAAICAASLPFFTLLAKRALRGDSVPA